MIVDVSKKILIVGLVLLGGSYAKVLKRFGFHISAITKEQSVWRITILKAKERDATNEQQKTFIAMPLLPEIKRHWRN